MEVNCEECAGCCIDWRPLSQASLDHERCGRRDPLDDTYNLVPLTRTEVRRFVDAGEGDVLTPRLWHADDEDGSVRIDGVDVAAIDGRPAFFVGLRKPPKPIAPFGVDRRWLRACVFLDPETLQCRIHDSATYPGECADYPGHNLALERETECERVEHTHGGDRLLDRSSPPTGTLLLGPQALGWKVFVHPSPSRLDGIVARVVEESLTPADRAEFVAVAAASAPGTLTVDEQLVERAREQVLETESWAGAAIDDWERRARAIGTHAADAHLGQTVEVERGAPETPGWDRLADSGRFGDKR